jgi:hypothetical protein
MIRACKKQGCWTLTWDGDPMENVRRWVADSRGSVESNKRRPVWKIVYKENGRRHIEDLGLLHDCPSREITRRRLYVSILIPSLRPARPAAPRAWS